MRLTTAAMALLSLVLAETCGTAPSSGARDANPTDQNCHLRVISAPQVYGEGKLTEIRATVKATCQVPPPHHHLHLTLEFDLHRDGHFMVQSAGFDENLIPDAAGYERSISFGGCIPGLWRVKGEVDGTALDGKTPFAGTLNGQATLIHTCPGP